ncbi:Cytochrome c, mono-and diheme variants family (fragment) [Verrucomicrobia bacterium]
MNDTQDPDGPLLLDHESDGIRELDNELPTWWVWLFNGSILFAVVYLCYYHVFHLGKLSGDEWKEEMRVGAALKNAAMGKFEATIPALTPAKDQVIVGSGQQTFFKYCAPCHRKDGGGLVGPNLCDDYWIHGSNFADNLTTIWNGVPAKGMITWKNYLKPDEVYAVASYIYTLRGTHPSNPKPPENQAPPAGPNAYE